MDRFEAELDKLANVGYDVLPEAADCLDRAERLVAQCDGMSNRRIFTAVDTAWADLRDAELRGALRELQTALLNIADAVRVVHARYGGADETSSSRLTEINANQAQTEGIITKLNQRREHERPAPMEDSEELAEQAAQDHSEDFVPWPFGDRDD